MDLSLPQLTERSLNVPFLSVNDQLLHMFYGFNGIKLGMFSGSGGQL
jgi:hypothetical protein